MCFDRRWIRYHGTLISFSISSWKVYTSFYTSYHYVPFYSMGSGSLAALGILEAKYQENLSIENGINLAAEAIEAGIFHDLGFLIHYIH